MNHQHNTSRSRSSSSSDGGTHLHNDVDYQRYRRYRVLTVGMLRAPSRRHCARMYQESRWPSRGGTELYFIDRAGPQSNHEQEKCCLLKILRARVAPCSHLAHSLVFLRNSLSLLAHTLPSLRVALTPRPISFLDENPSQATLISSAVKSVVALAAVIEFFWCSSDTSASAVSALKSTKRNGFNRIMRFYSYFPWIYCC